MVAYAHSAKTRAAFCCCVILLAVAAVLVGQGGAADAAGERSAEISIINGKDTKIKEWPWQVALVAGGPGNNSVPARKRYFCSGSLIARDLVVTAAHCVADLRPSSLRRLQVVSGRTRLSSDSGSSSYVERRIMPRDSNGRTKYRGISSPSWDVALLKLKRRLPAEPVKLAGGPEAAAFAPGSRVMTTGWGVTGPINRIGSNVLKAVTQVVLPDAVCRRDNGRTYQPKTMICLGGPAGNTSTCFGDSGGPLVSQVSKGWRLIGITSFGDTFCNPTVPSVDARASGNAIRGWVRRTAIRVSGVDPVGLDATVRPNPTWCRVPKLTGRSLVQAGDALQKAGCRLGAVRKNRFGSGRSGRVSFASLRQGWLTPPGNRIRVWLNP